MKSPIRTFLFAASFALSFFAVDAAEPTYISDFDQARAKSQEVGKPLIALFYGKW